MKCRQDYVTNSSSSSFILGKKGENITIEFVYSLIREIYLEYFSKKDKAIEYIKNTPDFGLYYDEKRNEFCYISGKGTYEKNIQLSKFLKEQFDLSIFDSFNYNTEWLFCKTYKEYESYWIHQIKTNHKTAPFTIGDFSSTEPITWLHWYYNGIVTEKHDCSAKSEVFEWYADYIYDLDYFNDENVYAKYDNELNKLKKENIFDSACLNKLGKICVYSESGYIPYYVVEKLSEFCTYHCNHMG